MPIQEQCYEELLLKRFLEEQIDVDLESKVSAHIGSCEVCRDRLEQLAGHADVWSDIHEHLDDLEFEGTEEHLAESIVPDIQQDLERIRSLLGPTDDPRMLGRLGHYEVIGIIGRGSAGIVVKALDPRLNRYVAIKILAPIYSENGSARRRFEREGRSIASVKDANVMPVYTVDDYQGQPFIVMQYMPDGSLHQRIEKHGPLTTREVVCVGMQIARGLAAAHRRGIVHRDVKPANVLLESGVERAMVTDFGLARVVDESTMTRSGAISGTPQYMSPEQAKGEPVDPRSDLFSLGSVMYAACTGHSPFRSETVFGVIKRVCDSEPRPIRETNPEIEEWLAALISKLHSKNRAERFESAEQVAELLALELAHLESPTMVPVPNRDWMPAKKRSAAASLLSRPAMAAGVLLTIGIASVPFGSLDWLEGLSNGGSKASSELVGEGTFANVAGIGAPEFKQSIANRIGTNGTLFGQGESANNILRVNERTLLLSKRESIKAPRFERVFSRNIPVKEGGNLRLNTNLGSIVLVTHDKSEVEIKLLHSIAADDQSVAEKCFEAIAIDYAFDDKPGLVEGYDASIVAEFPKREVTVEDIQASHDLDKLKEMVLIAKSVYEQDAQFEVRVPKRFHINVHTSAGSIKSDTIKGEATLRAVGGTIDAKRILGDAVLTTDGGSIVAFDIEGNATVNANGGHITLGDVLGNLESHSAGGSIVVGKINGTINATSRNGEIQVKHARSKVAASSLKGNIDIRAAEGRVDAKADSGSVTVNFVGQPNEDSHLEAIDGTVDIGVKRKLAFDVEASSLQGDVTGPFVRKPSDRFAGRLNAGGSRLEVLATRGPVRFHYLDPIDGPAHNPFTERALANIRGHVPKHTGLFEKAYEFHTNGDLELAKQQYQVLLKENDTHCLANYNLGCVLAQTGELDGAIKAIDRAVTAGFSDLELLRTDEELEPLRKDLRLTTIIKRLEAEARIEDILRDAETMLDDEQLDEAEALYRQAHEANPKLELPLFKIGYALHMKGDYEAAIEWHKRAAKTRSYAKLGNFNLACAYAKTGKADLAFEYLQKAIDAGFCDMNFLETDSDLDSIRDDKRFKAVLSSLEEDCTNGKD